MNDPISLFKFNQIIRRALVLNFPEAVWVKAEIDQCSTSRGHYYIDLVEKDMEEDNIKAQMSAVLWSAQYRKLLAKYKSDLQNVLKPGVEIICKVQLTFHERYGLKLNIEDVDLDFNIGQAELKRRAIIKQLETEDLLFKNRETSMPDVISKVAIISAVGAAGYQDFKAQIASNAFDYKFEMTLFPAAMQGDSTDIEVREALAKIESSKRDYDVVCLVRGWRIQIRSRLF